MHIPVVLSREEVAALLAQIPPEHWLICALLYGAGLRLEECLSLRIKDVDFARRIIYVRHGKGSKDRIVMLPAPVTSPIRAQIEVSRLSWTQDRANGAPGVEVPHALARKLGRAAESFTWHWLFPAATLGRDPQAGHHHDLHARSGVIGRRASQPDGTAADTRNDRDAEGQPASRDLIQL
jgi:integrase